jgi:hypothetical protein
MRVWSRQRDNTTTSSTSATSTPRTAKEPQRAPLRGARAGIAPPIRARQVPKPIACVARVGWRIHARLLPQATVRPRSSTAARWTGTAHGTSSAMHAPAHCPVRARSYRRRKCSPPVIPSRTTRVRPTTGRHPSVARAVLEVCLLPIGPILRPSVLETASTLISHRDRRVVPLRIPLPRGYAHHPRPGTTRHPGARTMPMRSATSKPHAEPGRNKPQIRSM